MCHSVTLSLCHMRHSVVFRFAARTSYLVQDALVRWAVALVVQAILPYKAQPQQHNMKRLTTQQHSMRRTEHTVQHRDGSRLPRPLLFMRQPHNVHVPSVPRKALKRHTVRWWLRLGPGLAAAARGHAPPEAGPQSCKRGEHSECPAAPFSSPLYTVLLSMQYNATPPR